MHKILITIALLLIPALGRGAGPAQVRGAEPSQEDIRAYTDFLYSAMPLPDKAMHSRDFYESNVRSSLRARSEMPWGKSVPEREFRHFVVPVRVNNENLDSSRMVFYEELRDRVKGLSMTEAVLEVNHWCHEKVTYQPSDARTSSPLSSVSQAIGRCGEESTFTVAALRAMCIPARQVYTPRWAHTDDNHAWVEAWADGQWHFLGACEPEPILDLAWFNAPASRGMLMNTSVFGDYRGPEEVISRSPYYTVINVTSNYAPVAPVRVRVTDAKGAPVKDARVDFRLYNYAEFYPLASLRTDADGRASLITGEGDVLVWASDGKRYGFAKGNPSQPVSVVLDRTADCTGAAEFDLVPPPLSASLPQASAEQTAENDRRKAAEDSIRNAYTAGFATDDSARELNKGLGLDEAALIKVLRESRGNHRMISEFLLEQPAGRRQKALDLLQAVSEKDRRDISREVLDDHILTEPSASPLYRDYILNPRVENEGLTPYKGFFRTVLTDAERAEYREHPERWIARLQKQVRIIEEGNPKLLRMSPEAAWRAGKADKLSAGICFVAGARSCGIPARIDPVTGKPQYADESGAWTDVKLRDQGAATPARTGRLAASGIVTSTVPDPKYYYHYSICRLDDDGFPRQLEYPEGITLKEFLDTKPELDEGSYMLVTGQRLADGSVLTRSQFFTIREGETTAVPFIFRTDDKAVQVIGSFNSEDIYSDKATGTDKSILSTTGRGYYVVILGKPNHEPTEHALNDISALRADFEAQPEKILLLFPDAESASRFRADRFPNLPSTVVTGADIDGRIEKELRENLHLPQGEYPVIVIADTFNRVVHATAGYTIGTGDTLLSILRRLKQ